MQRGFCHGLLGDGGDFHWARVAAQRNLVSRGKYQALRALRSVADCRIVVGGRGGIVVSAAIAAAAVSEFFPKECIRTGATRPGRCDGGTSVGAGNRRFSAWSLPSFP